MSDADSTCIVDLPEPDTEGERFDIKVEAIWGPGWLPCSVEIEE